MSEIRFYLDENVPLAVSEQLALSGIDVVSTHALERLGDTDSNHLQRATDMNRVLCTHDQDFLRMAAEDVNHTGIAFAPQYLASIGGWVRALRALHGQMSAEEVQGKVILHAVTSCGFSKVWKCRESSVSKAAW